MKRKRSASSRERGRLEARSRAAQRPRQRDALRDEERAERHGAEAGRGELGADRRERELARVQVEHELALREAGDAAEERRAVVRVVERAEDRGRSDRLRPARTCSGRRRRRRSRAPGLQRPSPASRRRRGSAARKERREPAVAAGEVEDRVALGPERRPEARARAGAVREVAAGVGVLLLRPARRLARVLLRRPHHARSRSGMTCAGSGAIARACQSVRREKKVRSIAAS